MQSGLHGRLAGTGVQDHLLYLWPAYGGSDTPYGKGLAYLSQNEARTAEALARSQVADLLRSDHKIRGWTGTRQVCNAYGITETGSWVAGWSNADVPAEDGLIGTGWGAVIKVLRTAEASVPLDPASECAVDESGYVWLNTPALMQGYFQRGDLTEMAVVDGWFFTGDIGALNARSSPHDRPGIVF